MTSTTKPNIILVVTDQQRGDCIEIDGHPVLQTPCMNWIAESGTRFSNAYTACSVCIPARRTLMSGQKPSKHGCLHNYATDLKGPVLPELLRDAGYQTQLCGKLHLWPLRKHYGFEGFQWSDGPGASPSEGDSDYIRYLRHNGHARPEEHMAHGVEGESCYVRSWHMEERFHVANWATETAIDFIETRDPIRPFFLKLSYFHPHPPITPPQFYYDRYMSMDMPEPVEADWSTVFDEPSKGLPGSHPRQKLSAQQLKQYRAAYYAQINHIDDQMRRFFNACGKEGIDLSETLIIFCSDHGEMLGDHQWTRKCVPYQGSVRVPFLLKLPKSMGNHQQKVSDKPVELMDIMPTILEAAGVKIPETVDGDSVLPLIRGEHEWREYVHSEINCLNEGGTGYQMLTDGKRKYIWFPGRGVEQFFDLESDPEERVELSKDPTRQEEIASWSSRLVEELKGRPEGFTDGEKLLKLDGPTMNVLPGFERPEDVEGEGQVNFR